jgi:biopolymer transport protein ExbB
VGYFSKVSGTLLDYFIKGGPVMWPLLLASIIGIAIIIERILALRKAKINAAEFMTNLRNLLLNNKIEQAIEQCDKAKSPVASVIKSALLRYNKTEEDIKTAIEVAAVYEVGRLERGLTILATIANIAPLLGFLGTVTGMIRSFGVLAKVGLGDPGAVAAGISEALITTAAGLIIAIPVQFAHNFFTAKISLIVRDMETLSGMLLEILKEISTKK